MSGAVSKLPNYHRSDWDHMMIIMYQLWTASDPRINVVRIIVITRLILNNGPVAGLRNALTQSTYNYTYLEKCCPIHWWSWWPFVLFRYFSVNSVCRIVHWFATDHQRPQQERAPILATGPHSGTQRKSLRTDPRARSCHRWVLLHQRSAETEVCWYLIILLLSRTMSCSQWSRNNVLGTVIWYISFKI